MTQILDLTRSPYVAMQTTDIENVTVQSPL